MIIHLKYLTLRNLFRGEKILFYFIIHKTKLTFLLVLTTNSALHVGTPDR